MGIRGIIKDIIFLYISIQLLLSGVLNKPLAKSQLLIYGFLIFGFTFWFFLEKIGVIPKV